MGLFAKSHAGKKPLNYATDNPREPLRINAKTHAGKTPLLAGYVLEKEATYNQNFAHMPATYFHKMFTFNSGNFEKCVTLLRDKHKSKDLAPVVQSIFSHESVVKKNQLTIKLIVSTTFNL